MHFFRDLSIRWKLTLLFGAVVTVVLLLTGVVDTWIHLRTTKDQMVREYTALASVLGDNSAVALTVFPESAQEVISDLQVSRAVLAAGIYLPDDTLVARYPEEIPDTNLPEQPSDELFRFSDRYLLINHIVEQEGTPVGKVFLRVSTSQLGEALQQKIFLNASILSSALLVAVLLSLVVQRVISRPIQQLAKATRTVEKEADFSIRVARPSRDEIGELCQGFNSMLDQLQRRDTALAAEIAERKRFENHFRLAVDGAPVAMVMTDRDRAVVTMNSGAQQLFGYSDTDLVGRPITVILPSFAESPQLIETGDACETRGIRRDETTFPVEISFSPITTDEGEFGLTSIVDISLRKEAQQKLQELNATLERLVAERTEALEEQSRELSRAVEDLQRSNQELDDFAYIASHDLKEPLRGISNYASFLSEDYDDKLDDDGRTKLETLKRLCKRMESLIDSLLMYSRVGRAEMAIQPTNVNELLAEIVDSLHVVLHEQNVVIRVPQPLPTVTCDRVRVGEVFRNLITNAYKYNEHEEKVIEVGWSETEPAEGDGQEDAETVFYVRDNGIGIREKHLESVFRIFKRLHARDRYGGGTGAGLTFVKKIIERHGGRIWVESEQGKGSTFFFTIPRQQADPESASTN